MRDSLHIIQLWLMLVCFLSLAVICIIATSQKVCTMLKKMVRGPVAVFALAVFATLYGGTKNARVSFPRTDPDIAYLVDVGSYVTNDLVHLDFRRVLVPDSAPFLLDRRPIESSDDGDWETFFVSTFEDMSLPFDLPCENADQWQWAAYSTWTPGPAVQTNGVWHLTWQTDSKGRGFFVPIRTGVYTDGYKIAPPVKIDPKLIMGDYE